MAASPRIAEHTSRFTERAKAAVSRQGERVKAVRAKGKEVTQRRREWLVTKAKDVRSKFRLVHRAQKAAEAAGGDPKAALTEIAKPPRLVPDTVKAPSWKEASERMEARTREAAQAAAATEQSAGVTSQQAVQATREVVPVSLQGNGSGRSSEGSGQQINGNGLTQQQREFAQAALELGQGNGLTPDQLLELAKWTGSDPTLPGLPEGDQKARLAAIIKDIKNQKGNGEPISAPAASATPRSTEDAPASSAAATPGAGSETSRPAQSTETSQDTVNAAGERPASSATRAETTPVSSEQESTPVADEAVRADLENVIRNIIGGNDTLSHFDSLRAQYFVQKAVLAGIPKEQLRADLDGSLTAKEKRPIINADGTRDVVTVTVTKNELVASLGLPTEISDKAVDITVTEAEQVKADTRRRELMREIIQEYATKNPPLAIASLLPEQDVREAVGDVVQKRIAEARQSGKLSEKNAAKVEQLMLSYSTDNLAILVAYPERFAPERNKVVDKIRKRIKYIPGYRHDKVGRDQKMRRDQLIALTGAPSQLKSLSEEYKNALPIMLRLFQTILAAMGIQILELMKTESAGAVEGQNLPR